MTRKNTIIALVVALAIVAGFLLFDYLSDNDIPRDDGQNINATEAYFISEVERLAINRVGQPIEGFNAFILTQAFPELEPEDFEGVSTLEGVYEVSDGELIFRRTRGMPITSAEEAINDQGMLALLMNVSARLDLDIRTRADIDHVIERISPPKTSETNDNNRTRVGLGDSFAIFDIAITPVEVLEDSRCPIDVNCVWEGTVRLLAEVIGGSSRSGEMAFSLRDPVEIGGGAVVTLESVVPEARDGISISNEDYEFIFSIKEPNRQGGESRIFLKNAIF